MPLSGTKGNGLKPLKLFGFSVILNHECQEHEAMKMKEMRSFRRVSMVSTTGIIFASHFYIWDWAGFWLL